MLARQHLCLCHVPGEPPSCDCHDADSLPCHRLAFVSPPLVCLYMGWVGMAPSGRAEGTKVTERKVASGQYHHSLRYINGDCPLLVSFPETFPTDLWSNN